MSQPLIKGAQIIEKEGSVKLPEDGVNTSAMCISVLCQDEVDEQMQVMTAE